MTGNGEKLTDDIVIRNFIPTIATIWQKTITVSKTDYEHRFKQCLRTYEVLLKSIAAALYGRARYYHSHVPEIEQFLKDKLTLGRFLRFNHACRKVLKSKGDPWTQELEQALSQELTEQAVIHVCHTTRVDLKEESQWNKKAVTVRELFTTLVELRNRTDMMRLQREFLKTFMTISISPLWRYLGYYEISWRIVGMPFKSVELSRTKRISMKCANFVGLTRILRK